MSQRTVLAAVAALAAFGAVSASAASLGGVRGLSLGAGSTVVRACDTDGVDVSFNTSYSAAAGDYLVHDVILGGVDAACSGQDVAVTIAASSGAPLGSATGVATAAAQQTFGFPSPVLARNVDTFAVVIAG